MTIEGLDPQILWTAAGSAGLIIMFIGFIISENRGLKIECKEVQLREREATKMVTETLHSFTSALTEVTRYQQDLRSQQNTHDQELRDQAMVLRDIFNAVSSGG